MSGDRRPPAEWFSRWWEPREFFASVQEHIRRLFPNWDLLLHPDATKFREGYASGLFASILSDHETTSVRLETDEARFPDFYIRRAKTVFRFELVEAIRPGYKRGAVYNRATERKKLGQPPRLPRLHWLRAEDTVVRSIRDAVEKKARKSYQPSPCLLIYVSIPLFREYLPLAVTEVANSLALWREHFPEAWCLWGAHAARFWPDPASLQLRAELPDLFPR